MKRRWLVRIAVCVIFLTGGAITTVVVAWGLTLRQMLQPSYTKYSSHSDGRQWQVAVSTRLGETSVERVPNNGEWSSVETPRVAPEVIPYWSVARERPPEDVFDDPTLPWHVEYAYGWPCRSGRAEVRTLVRTASGQHIPRNVWSATSGIEVVRDNPSNKFVSYRVLPVQPIWPGFLLDTLFYAAIWFGMFFGFTSAKRAIRIRRGRCPMCGYDLRGQRAEEVSGQKSEISQSPHPNPLPPPDLGEGARTGCPECGWNRAGDQAG